MRWRPSGRPGSESVHSTTLATLAEQSRCQVGPTILFDRPRPGSPVPPPSDFPVGPAARWRREQSGRVMGCGRNFQTVARRQVLTVREQRSNRDAMAAPRAAWESVHRTTLATRDEPNRCQVGPTILLERPPARAPSLLHQISLWGQAGLTLTRRKPMLTSTISWPNCMMGATTVATNGALLYHGNTSTYYGIAHLLYENFYVTSTK